MSFERKDLIPTAIALLALGVQVGGFVNRAFGWVALASAVVVLTIYYITREQRTKPLAVVERPSDAELSMARRRRALEELKELHGAINGIYLQLVVAANDDEIVSGLGEYQRWANRCRSVVSEHFGEGEAEAFQELGPLQSVDIVVQHPQKSLYRWGDKVSWMHRLDLYRPRLTALMRRLDMIRV